MKDYQKLWHSPCITPEDVVIMKDISAKLPDNIRPDFTPFAGISNGKRSTEQEARMYDAEFTAIINDRMAEKESARKHRAGKAYRHRKPENRRSKRMRWAMKVGHEEVSNDAGRNFYREIMLREDYNLELRNIADLPSVVDKMLDEAGYWKDESDFEEADPYGDILYINWAWKYGCALEREADRIIAEEFPVNHPWRNC